MSDTMTALHELTRLTSDTLTDYEFPQGWMPYAVDAAAFREDTAVLLADAVNYGLLGVREAVGVGRAIDEDNEHADRIFWHLATGIMAYEQDEPHEGHVERAVRLAQVWRPF